MSENGKEFPQSVHVPEPLRPLFLKAEEAVSRYFEDRVQDLQRSAIEISGERYITVRAASLSTEFFALILSLYQDREEQEARSVAHNFLFDLAHAIGKADARALHSRMNVTSPIEKLSLGPIHFAYTGWAFVEILPESNPTPDENCVIVYDHPYSFEADEWLKKGTRTEFPVCIMSAGYSSGWCEESFGISLVATEIRCRAKGDERCRFIMAPPAKIQEYIAGYDVTPAQRASAISVPQFFLRKQAEEALRRSEQRYRLLADHATDVIWTMDMNLRFTYISPSITRLRGYSVEEAVAQSLEEVCTPESAESAVGVFLEELEIEGRENKDLHRSRTLELEHRCKNGSTVWVEVRMSFLRDPENRALGIVGITRDITDRKRAEAAQHRSEETYRLLVENSIDAVFVAQDGVFKFANPATSLVTGYANDELLGVPFLDLVHPEDRPLVMETHAKRLEGKPVPRVFSFRILNKKGGLLWVEVGGTRIIWNDRPATLNFVRDVTEKKQLENQLRQVHKMEAIGTLAGGIAHDFNNILAAILGFTELTLARSRENVELRGNLEEILKAGKRAKDLVQQILSFSRQDEQMLEPVRLRPIVEACLESMQVSSAPAMEIRLHTPAQTDVILADAEKIRRVLLHLLSNAAYSMKEKGGVIDVTLEDGELVREDSTAYPELRPGGYLKLTIQDTGCGMKKEVMDRIFDPYFTTKRLGEGSGMGLSVAHGIVKDHGGAITVSSKEGEGTRFEILFPRIDAGPRDRHGPKVEPLGRAERILFVDDEELLADLGKKVLERFGYHVVSKFSAQQALEALRAEPYGFDLVITDMSMPGKSGLELAADMRRIRSDIPVILCSGFSEGMTPETMEEMGIQALLHKPILMKDLVGSIQTVMSSSKSEERCPEATILVVDDDEQVRALLRQMFEREGYEVVEAVDGKQGVKLWREQTPDLLVTDVFMPEVDGIEMIRIVREESPHAKIIAISGGGRVVEGEYLRYTLMLGANRVFAKPLDHEKFLEAVRDLLSGEKEIPPAMAASM